MRVRLMIASVAPLMAMAVSAHAAPSCAPDALNALSQLYERARDYEKLADVLYKLDLTAYPTIMRVCQTCKALDAFAAGLLMGVHYGRPWPDRQRRAGSLSTTSRLEEGAL